MTLLEAAEAMVAATRLEEQGEAYIALRDAIRQHKTENPQVGMGATLRYGSDVYPYTIIWVALDGKTIVAQGDIFKPGPGHHYINNQVYEYEPNVFGERKTFTLRKNGLWIEKGDSLKGPPLSIGVRRYYQDPGF